MRGLTEAGVPSQEPLLLNFSAGGYPYLIWMNERRDEGKDVHFDLLPVMDHTFSFGNYPGPGSGGRTYRGKGVSERISTRTYGGQDQPQLTEPPPCARAY